MMNIKEVEKLTDISSQNIRFYEKHGLITPSRNSENGYREYTEKDVQRLKLIKMFRMIDMPVEEIRHILSQEKSLSDSLKSQQALLKLKLEETKYALQMCEEIHEKYPSVQDIDVDKCLSVMNEEPSHFFSSWINDYKDVVEYDHQRTFTFMPDVEITDKYSFLNALYAYAMETDKEIVITKESMYPEFLLDGVPYTAERFFENVRGIPVSVIRCTRKDMLEHEVEYAHGRKKWIRIFRICLPYCILFVFFLLSNGDWFAAKEGWIGFGAALLTCIAFSIRNYYLYWNRDYRYEDSKKK